MSRLEAKELVAVREEFRLTQAEFARVLGLPIEQLEHFELVGCPNAIADRIRAFCDSHQGSSLGCVYCNYNEFHRHERARIDAQIVQGRLTWPEEVLADWVCQNCADRYGLTALAAERRQRVRVSRAFYDPANDYGIYQNLSAMLAEHRATEFPLTFCNRYEADVPHMLAFVIQTARGLFPAGVPIWLPKTPMGGQTLSLPPRLVYDWNSDRGSLTVLDRMPRTQPAVLWTGVLSEQDVECLLWSGEDFDHALVYVMNRFRVVDTDDIAIKPDWPAVVQGPMLAQWPSDMPSDIPVWSDFKTLQADAPLSADDVIQVADAWWRSLSPHKGPAIPGLIQLQQ